MPDDNSEVLSIYIPGPPVLTFPDDRLPGPSAEMTGPEIPLPELPGPSVTTLSPGALPGLPGELDDGLLSVPGEGLLSVPDEEPLSGAAGLPGLLSVLTGGESGEPGLCWSELPAVVSGAEGAAGP